MKCELCIFDLDGTLVHTLTDIAASANEMLIELGFPTHEIADYRYFVGNGSKKLIERILPPESLTNTADSSSEELINKALELYKARYKQNLLKTTHIYEGITPMLETMQSQGIKLAICTNKHHEAASEIVAKLFPQEMFHQLIGDKPNMPRKPDPYKLLLIAQELAVEKNKVLYFGDSGVDMETGKRAGMTSVGVLWGFREEKELKASGADILISEPQEIFSKIN